MGFVSPEYTTLSPEHRQEMVISQLQRTFGKQAGDILAYEEVVWATEVYTKAGDAQLFSSPKTMAIPSIAEVFMKIAYLLPEQRLPLRSQGTWKALWFLQKVPLLNYCRSCNLSRIPKAEYCHAFSLGVSTTLFSNIAKALMSFRLVSRG